jgi:hypothetical protein
MQPRVITIDGKTYNSVEEMPPDIRQKFELAIKALGDTNNNNIPDAFETINIFADKNRNGAPDVLENIAAGQAALNSMKIVVDGKEFTGIENLPPEIRARYNGAMRQLDTNGNGIPDFVEGVIQPGDSPAAVSTSGVTATPRRAPMPGSSAATPDTTNGWLLVLTGLFIFGLCAAGVAGVWYFFLR